MRRLIAAAVLAAIIAGLCFANKMTVNKTYYDLSAGLSRLEQAYMDSPEAAADLARSFEKEWVSREDYLSIFVNHEIITELGIAISRLPVMIDSDCDEFTAECAAVRTILLHMLKDTEISLHSVF